MANGGASGEGAGRSTLHRVFGWSSVARSYGAGRMNLTNPRNLRNDIHQVIMGLSPLIEHSNTRVQAAPPWIQQQRSTDNVQQSEGGTVSAAASSPGGGAYVINMEPGVSTTPPLEDLRTPDSERPNPAPRPGSETGTETEDRWNTSPELRALLGFVDKYLTFVLILLLKLAFDHRVGLLVILGLFITFCHANSVIKREVGKQGKRQFSGLLIVVVNLLTCVCFVYFVLAEAGLAYA